MVMEAHLNADDLEAGAERLAELVIEAHLSAKDLEVRAEDCLRCIIAYGQIWHRTFNCLIVSLWPRIQQPHLPIVPSTMQTPTPSPV